ncbi:non-specific lipid transfer protein GPI-anchored 20-like [Lotus japonicus]|uniref:non-specific lipid transfer protein GPI-anchored 20-like n=1 Tax=Lotus japonicus TaxID=34305 RepID=UPI002589BA9A|nr:non-specific lipid transfer protein GPI-anchored 20-like [Lotus japonicus]
MERFVPLALVLAMAIFMAAPGYAQINTPCNVSAISTSFTPCMSFLTNSSGNGTSPTAECCDSIKSLTSGGRDCLCLVVTGNVPFSIPINRTLAISLPRACKLPGVPLQCKTSGSPLPAPGPASLGPSSSPESTPSATSPSPQGSSSALPSPVTPSLAPSDSTPPLLTPSSSTTGSGRSNLTPSSAVPSYSLFPSFVFIVFGFAVFKHY